MAYSSELQSLVLISVATLLMWAPYVLMRFVKWGLWAPFANPDPKWPALPAWADRAKEAHRNGVENLVTFAAVVLVVLAVLATARAAVDGSASPLSRTEFKESSSGTVSVLPKATHWAESLVSRLPVADVTSKYAPPPPSQ